VTNVEAVSLKGQGIHVAQPDVGIVDAGAGEVGARQRQHLARLVDAIACSTWAPHFEQPPVRCDVEQPRAPTGR